MTISNPGKYINIYMTNTTQGYNKWYRMERSSINSSKWNATWGPLTAQGTATILGTKDYEEPAKMWYNVFKEKIKKGYEVQQASEADSDKTPDYTPDHLKDVVRKLKVLRGMIDKDTFNDDWDRVEDLIFDITNDYRVIKAKEELEEMNDLFRKHKLLNSKERA